MRRLGFGRWLTFLALCVGMFMAILDIQIVAASLPDIQAGLHVPRSALSWIQTGYLIAEIIAIMVSGSLTRILSTGGLFTVAVIGFTLASLGCGAANSFAMLVAFRVVQGFCGGAIIPTVFTGGFLLFPPEGQGRATLVAGLFAVLAPAVGPCLGGYMTETYSWRWLFLINLAPGILVATIAALRVRVDRAAPGHWRHLDVAGFVLLATSLACFQLLLKDGPETGWQGRETIGLLAVLVASGFFGVRRCLRRAEPLVDFRLLAKPGFGLVCLLSFMTGVALYSSVYLLPLFLGFVRDHTALEIGIIMTAMGAAQLATAPLAAFAEKRWPPALVAALGFALFATGLAANGFETPRSDAADLVWPQMFRGAAVLLCLIPVTTMALRWQPMGSLAQASALVNLLRNLGGAVGIAVVDTIIDLRPGNLAKSLGQRLLDGDRATAAFVGLPLDRFQGVPIGPVDPVEAEFARPMVEKAAATLAFNEAWLVLAASMLICLPVLALWARGAYAAANRVTPRAAPGS